MPNRQGCRVCGKRERLYELELTAKARGHWRIWLIQVCRGCWRVFEVMLDEAMVGMQPHLSARSAAGDFLV